MKSKREQILELCEISEQDFKNIPINGNSRTASANIVNHKLLPIITALLDRVEQLEGALEWIETVNAKRVADIWNDYKQEPYEYLSTQISEAISSVDTSPLDKLLEGEK